MAYRIFLFHATKMATVCKLKYSLQKASCDIVLHCTEDNVQVALLFNAHRNYAEKIDQQHSHFRTVILEVFVCELLLLKG